MNDILLYGNHAVNSHFFLPMIGLREWFAQTDERTAPLRIPVMVNMASSSVSSQKSLKVQGSSVHASSSDQMNAANRNSVMLDEYSDEDEEYQIPENEPEVQAAVRFIVVFLF